MSLATASPCAGSYEPSANFAEELSASSAITTNGTQGVILPEDGTCSRAGKRNLRDETDRLIMLVQLASAAKISGAVQDET